MLGYKFYREIFEINEMPVTCPEFLKAFNLLLKEIKKKEDVLVIKRYYVEKYEDGKCRLPIRLKRQVLEICSKNLGIKNAFILGDLWMDAYKSYCDLTEEIKKQKEILFEMGYFTKAKKEKKEFNISVNKSVLMKEVSITELHMSNRTTNTLLRNEVFTIADLLEYTKEELRSMRNLGNRSIDEIESFLKANNLKLAIKKKASA